MRWNKQNYRPHTNPKPVQKPFDFQEAIKPYGQKKMPAWYVVAVDNIVDVSPTPSPTPSATPGNTPTATPSNTPSNTPSITPSITSSPTPTITASNTQTPTPTNTSSPTPTITSSNTPTPTNTSSPTPTITSSNTQTPTPSITPSITPTNTPSNTPSTTPSQTPSNTPSVTPSITATNTPTPSSSPLPSGTTEARAYLTAVVNAGGTLSSTISAATETLFTSIVSAGLWDKITQFYPLLGGVAASNAIEGKSATSKITWNGGMTFSSSGAKSNGTNAYGEIAYNDNTLGTLNSFHLSFYSNQSLAKDDGLTYGILQSSNSNNLYIYDSSNESGIRLQTSNAYATVGSQTDTLGFFIATRTGSTSQRLYKNGTSITSNTVASTGKPNANQYVFARNNTGLPGADAYTNKRGAFLSIGLALTQTDATNLQNAVHTFNTTLSRNY